MFSLLKFLVLFTIALFGYGVAVNAITDAVVVDILNADTTYATNYQPYREGIYAFLSSIKGKAMQPIGVTMESPGPNTSVDIVTYARNAVKRYNNLCFIGPYSDQNLKLLIAAFGSYLFFGPLTGGITNRGMFLGPALFTRISPKGELLALLKYAVLKLRLQRFGTMYTTGVLCGEELEKALEGYIVPLQRSESGLYVYNEADSKGLNKTMADGLVAYGAQAIFVIGFPGASLQSAVSYVLNDRAFSGAILAPSYQSIMVQNLVLGLTRTSNLPTFVSSSSAQSISIVDTSMQSFFDNMKTYLTANPVSGQSATVAQENEVIGGLMLQGYITGAALAFAVRDSSIYTNGAYFNEHVYNSYSSFSVHGFTLGYYATNQSPSIQTQGGFSPCNEGGQAVWVMEYPDTKTTIASVVDKTENENPYCGLEGDLPVVTNVVFLNYADNEVLKAGYDEAVSANLTLGGNSNLSVGSSTSYWTEAFYVESSDYTPRLGDVIIGPYDPTVTENLTDALIFSPLYSEPQVDMYGKNTYHITPVFSQSILTLYAGLTSDAGLPINGFQRTMVTGVVKSTNATQVYFLQEAIVQLSSLFNFVAYVVTCDTGSTMSGSMWPSGTNILAGMKRSDVSSVVSFLESNANVVAFLPYRTMSIVYSDLSSALTRSPAVSERVLFDSNFQFANEGKTALEGEYSLAVSLLRDSPLFFRGGPLTATTLPLSPFGVVNGTAKNGFGDPVRIEFAPKGTNDPLTARSLYRGRNYGATLNSLYNFKDFTALFSNYPDASLLPALDAASVTSPALPTGPEIKAKEELIAHAQAVQNKTTSGLWAFGAIGIVICLVGLAVFLWILLVPAFNAPKDPRKPITIVHINVDYDASLWSELPGVMSPMLLTQQKLIRTLVKKYKCYEVRSDGTSYVIASKSAFSAVQLAMDVQAALLQPSWASPIVDKWYKFIEQKTQTVVESDEEVEFYSDSGEELFCGIRSRIAVDTGICGIRSHHMFYQYSYFGPHVYLATRAQSIAHGGQVIVSESTWNHLSSEQLAVVDHFYLGSYRFSNDLPPTSFFCVNSVPGKLFPPLRSLPEKLQSFVPRKEALPQLSKRYASELKWAFSPSPDDVKEDYLEMFAECWGVTPPEQEDMTDSEYWDSLIDLIAAKMAGSELYESGEDEEDESEDDDESLHKPVLGGQWTERNMSMNQVQVKKKSVVVKKRKSVVGEREKSAMSERGKSAMSERGRSAMNERGRSAMNERGKSVTSENGIPASTGPGGFLRRMTGAGGVTQK